MYRIGDAYESTDPTRTNLYINKSNNLFVIKANIKANIATLNKEALPKMAFIGNLIA